MLLHVFGGHVGHNVDTVLGDINSHRCFNEMCTSVHVGAWHYLADHS